MTFWSNIGIVFLAELIKWSSPWYVWQTLASVLRRIGPSLVLFGTLIFFVMVFPAEDNATYRTLTFEEIWGSLLPERGHDEKPLLPSAPPPPPIPLMTFPEVPATKNFERDFPLPEELKAQVALWKDVFSRYTSRQFVIHDATYFQLVYAVIDLDRKPASISGTIATYRRILRSLAKKTTGHEVQALTPEELEVYKLFQHIKEKDKFSKAAEREIRVQSGQRDRFMEAIRVSGLYHQHFLQIFQAENVPLELTWLPFVESYYKHQAYSYAGAAGIWQFMPSTAKLYGLQMNSTVDERFDPFESAESAAKLLKANYDLFGSWPLAITAYNHGPAGMLNAVKQLGTTDFGKIATKYQSRSFGFYSRNYYAQFLAVVQIMRDAQNLFGDLECFPALQYEEVQLDRRLYLKDLTTLLALSPEQLTTLNRGLKSAVIQSKSPLPANFTLKLPPGKKQELLVKLQTRTLPVVK